MTTMMPRPPLTISEADFDRLYTLANDVRRRSPNPEIAEYLLDELERADQVPPEAMPADVVAMGSQVRYRDEATGRERTVTLVFPGVEDAATGAVSILTPVGAALIGMRPGARIDWTAPSGDQRILTVLEVRPPERSQ